MLHSRHIYSSIHGKELYPVALNPIEPRYKKRPYYHFNKYQNRYIMIRGDFYDEM